MSPTGLARPHVGSRRSQVLVGTTVLALVASLAAPAVAADTPAPADSRQVQAVDEAAPEVGKLEPTTPLKGEELASSVLSFTQLTPARPGGHGDVRMSLVPEDADTDPMRNLVVRMRVAKGVRWERPRVSGWKCTTQRRGVVVTCRHPAMVPGGTSLSMDLALMVSKKRKVSAKKTARARITGTASWRTTQGSKSKSWLETGSGTLKIEPKLGVRLAVAGDGNLAMISDTDRGARALQLVGTLRRVVGQQVDVTWRQVRGPKVRFVSDRTVTTDERQVSQTVLLPKRYEGNRRLVFELRAAAGGQVVKDRASVRITADRLQGKVAPRNHLIGRVLNQAPDDLRAMKQLPTPPLVRSPGKVRLVGPKRGLALPGQDVTLRITSKPRVKSVLWVTHTESGAESTTLAGKRFTVTTPLAEMGYIRVEAYIRLAGKRAVVRSFTLMPKPGANSVAGPIPDDDEKKNKKRFCELATSLLEAKAAGDTPVEVTTKDKSVLKLKPSKVAIPTTMFPTPDNCSGKGTIDFGNAQLVASAGATFNDVDGTISLPDGIKMTSMSWILDEKLRDFMPTAITAINLKGKLTVGFDSKQAGEWDAITGTSYLQPWSVAGITSSGIPLVPVPEGWEVSPKDGAFLQFFKDEDKGAPEGSIKFVQKSAPPASTAGESIELGVIRNRDSDNKPNWGKVYGAVNNIEVFKTPNGETVLASGDVMFELTAKKGGSSDQLNLQITCADPTSKRIQTACPMGEAVYFKDGKLRLSLPWGGDPTTGGYLLSATVVFGDEDASNTLGIEGAYTSKDKWSAKVKEGVTFDMGPGMAATGFEGAIKRGKEEVDGEKKVVTTFDIAAKLSTPEFANEVSVRKATARITNMCERGEPDCRATEIRLKAGVELDIPIRGGTTIQTAMTGTYNWKTKGLLFRADVGPKTSMGPDEWNFEAGSIFASRAGYGYCQAQGEKERAPNVWAVGFQGKGTLFGETTNLTLQFSTQGSCIWGSMGKLETGALPTNGVVASWTSFPKGALVKINDKESFKIKANTGSLRGKVNLPHDVDVFLGSKGQLEFTGEISERFQGAAFEISYTGTSSNIVSQGENSFDLTKIALGMRWKVGDSAELFAGAEGLLTIGGDASTGIANSVTPLGVYFTVKASKTGVTMTLSAGMTGRPVNNAFGMQGLILRELGASATLTLPAGNVDVKFAADVTMPRDWESSGLKASARVQLAFSVGTGQPWCIDFQIGTQGSDKVALDVANAGFLVANYFRLLIAPAGCTVPISASETRSIPAGYGFAFEGRIMAAPIVVALNVGFGTGGVSSNFTMKGQIKLPKLELPLVTLSGADGQSPVTVSLDIDTAKRKYNASIDAGILVGYPDWGFGARVAIVGELKTTHPKEVTFQVTGSAEMKLPGAFMEVDPLIIDLAIPKGQITPTRAKVSARLGFGILGVKLLSGEVDMAYDQGALVQFGVLVGAGLDIKVAKFTGNLAFRYCLGVIGSSKTRDGRLADCSPFAYKATAKPGYRIDLGGQVKFLWWSTSYYWNINEQVGGEGDPRFEPKQKEGPLPGPTADIKQEDKAGEAFMRTPGSAQLLTLGDQQVAFRSIRPAEVQIPREKRTVKPCSSVQVGTQTYRPPPGTYPNAEILNPVEEGDCGLIGSYLILDNTHRSVSTEPVVCSQLECIADDKQFRLEGPKGSLRDARDQILSQLRQPPGVLPQGPSIFFNGMDPDLRKPGRLAGLHSMLWVTAITRRGSPTEYFLTFSSTAEKVPSGITQIKEFGKTTDKDRQYYLTDTGVLRASSGGGAVGENAALDKAPPPDKQPVLALIGERMVVYCGPTSDSGILWTYDKSGYKRVRDCKAKP